MSADIAGNIDLHISEKSTKHITKETLKWVDIAMRNAQQNFVEPSFKIKAKYLQLDLNAFVYKLNRRCFGDKILDRLVIASITAGWH